jgi:cytosine deaminase
MINGNSPSANSISLMALALAEAQKAASLGEVPVGAVLAGPDGAILATAHNLTETQRNPLAHAEMLAISAGLAQFGDKYLTRCTLAVTLEPCPMCMAALCHARIGTVIFGAYDAKSGGTVNGPRVPRFMHHQPHILGGIEEAACAALLQSFFTQLRAQNKPV